MSSTTNKKFKKKSKKHREKDRERDKGKRIEKGSTSPPNVAGQAEETRKSKKRRGAEEESREVINKNTHNDQGVFLSHKVIKTLTLNEDERIKSQNKCSVRVVFSGLIILLIDRINTLVKRSVVYYQ